MPSSRAPPDRLQTEINELSLIYQLEMSKVEDEIRVIIILIEDSGEGNDGWIEGAHDTTVDFFRMIMILMTSMNLKHNRTEIMISVNCVKSATSYSTRRKQNQRIKMFWNHKEGSTNDRLTNTLLIVGITFPMI